ncbi:MAG TPA: response regulator [Vicinamibacterales bacterium]|nr:response regulator [Vicinamibacterales bacterium]
MARPVILVAEDDDDLRRLYRTALIVAGYEVREAATGLDALQRIDAAPPDLIVLDLMLPKVSGFGVLYDLKAQAHTCRIPVIVVTGTSDDVRSEHVALVLRKPVAPDDLVAAVEQCLAAGGGQAASV